MKRYAFCAFVCLVALQAVGCENNPVAKEAKNVAMGLTIDDNNSYLLTGYYKDATSLIEFDAERVEGTHVVIAVLVDNHRLDYEVDVDRQGLRIEGHGAVLSETQKTTLSDLVESLADHFEYDIQWDDYHVLSLLNSLDYWSEAPADYVHNTLNFGIASSAHPDKVAVVQSASMGDEGIKCIKKGSYVYAEYDDSRGRHSDRIKVGSTARRGWECMGRCGGGCGKWWKASSWTKDCMDHDQCGNVNNSSGGASDSNCGDEFGQAADDWAFGVPRGCWG